MYNKNNLIEHNTTCNFNVSQFRRKFEANNNNKFRERLVFHSVNLFTCDNDNFMLGRGIIAPRPTDIAV